MLVKLAPHVVSVIWFCTLPATYQFSPLHRTPGFALVRENINKKVSAEEISDLDLKPSGAWTFTVGITSQCCKLSR